jgi:hypothetical protein
MNLIGEDITLMRDRYDEALEMQGIPCSYQFPLMPTSNAQGEAVVDSYSDMIGTHIFFDGNPKVKTYKRLGWVVENDKNLPFLVHCSFNLKNLQKDCLFHIAGQYTNMPDRIFRVTELTCDMQAPDHMVAQVVPVYDKNVVGRTKKEVEKTFNTSNHFLKPNIDYRGQYISEQDGER